MRQSVTYKEKSEGFANQTFRLLLVGRSRSGFSSPNSDTNYTLGLAVETITESSMNIRYVHEYISLCQGSGELPLCRFQAHMVPKTIFTSSSKINFMLGIYILYT